MVAFFFPPGGRKPVPSSSFLSEEIYSSFPSSSPSFSSVSFGTAAVDRLIVVALSWYNSGGSVRTLNSATIGGVSATILSPLGDGDESGVAIIQAVVPTGTSGTIALSFSGTVTRVSAGVYALYNLISSTAVDSDSSTSSGGFNSDTESVTLTTTANGIIVATGLIDASAGNTTATFSAGVTENYENVSGDFRANGGSGTASTTSTVITLSGTNDDFFDSWTLAICAACWR